MNKRFLIIKIFFFLFVSLNIKASDKPIIDSLLNVLETANEDTNKVNLYINISKKYLSTSTDKALIYANKALKLSENLKFSKGIAHSYIYIGIGYYYQGSYDNALREYFNALNIYKKIDDKQQIVKLLNNIGTIYNIKGEYDKAFNYYLECVKKSKEIGDEKLIAGSYNNIGGVFYAQGNYDKALEYYFESLNVSEKTDDKDMVARIFNNIGGIYQEQAKNDKALEYFYKSLKIEEEINDKRGVAETNNNISQILQIKKKYDEAIDINLKSIKIYQEIGDKKGVVVSYNMIANVYTAQAKNNFEKNHKDSLIIECNKALNYFFKSIETNQEVGLVEEFATSYNSIGEINYYLAHYNTSINYLLKAKAIGKKIGSPDIINNSAEILSKSYAAIHNYRKAYLSHVLFKETQDLLKNEENVRKLTQISMQWEFDKKIERREFEQNQKDLAAEAELRRQKIIQVFILFGFLIVLLFAFVVYRSYRRKRKDNRLLAEKNKQIEEQKQSITDSILYAKRIQQAILPSKKFIDQILPEHFILFRPRDIVSGDYYWLTQKENKIIIAAADCTGHGVPGAFMSMLGVSFLNEIVNKNNVTQANLILNNLREHVKRTLSQTGKQNEAKDGMDMALCVFDLDNSSLQFSGAYNSLYVIRENNKALIHDNKPELASLVSEDEKYGLFEVKADRMPVGIYLKEKESFTNNIIKINKGDALYIFSDGFSDQFGGKKGSKFKSKNFKHLLLSIQEKSMSRQKEILNTTIDKWRGDLEQVDDIIVFGLKI
ncbi:MAG: tetratricopeptide repeat protein [Bacteroidetes bacterium]|nr:tetratricopeptide repeat protein [Bacteroidota bacterium]